MKRDPLGEALRFAQAQRALPPTEQRRRIRISAGVSLQAIADTIGVDRVTVYRWEAGLRRPHGEQAVAYREALVRLADAAGAAA